MTGYSIKIIDESYDESIKTLVNNTNMPGNIEINFQTEPSFFKANAIKGKENQTFCAINSDTNKVIGIGTRSIKNMYVNGKQESIGYLSNLKIDTSHKKTSVLFKGYKFLKSLHQDKKTKLYITTIIDSNHEAKQILESKRLGLPEYYNLGIIYCAAINIFRKKNNNSQITIERGNQTNLKEIINCLNKYGSEKQFYPFNSESDLFFLIAEKGLSLEKFYLAKKNNKIVGVMAAWDQTTFKRVIVKKYNGKMKLIKPFYNFVANLYGYSPLPEKNNCLNFFYISFIAIESNNPIVFRQLLTQVYNDSVRSSYHYFIIGLHEKDPLLKVVKEFHHTSYESRLYAVLWDDGKDFLQKIDNRIPYVEIGML